jgi:alpha-amylase
VVRLLVFLLACVAFAQPGNNLVYEIFVRSFADTPADSNRIGDLRGLRENLDYVSSLHAGILWLMPVFPSGSYHGYDITDYRNINPDYGTLQDMDDLIKAAHQRGIRIILDIALNHTSTEHAWFRQAIRDPASPYRKFYHFDPKARNGYLALFSRNMPDLNLAEPEVRAEVKAIAKFWLDRGIDGFRLDAAKHVFGDTFGPIPDVDVRRNNEWWREFSEYVYRIKPEAILVGEVLGQPDVLKGHAPGLKALLDAPFMHAARSWIVKPTPGFLKNWIESSKGYCPFPFLGSHDENPRLATYLEHRKAPLDESYRLGMYLLLSLAKYPVIYNGDELMQRGRKWKGNPPDHRDDPGDGSRIYDETLREPFPWGNSGRPPQTAWFAPRFKRRNDGISVEEQNEPKSILSLVRALANLRNELPDYANGKLGSILADTEELLAFEKSDGRYLVLINATANTLDYKIGKPGELVLRSDGVKKAWKRERGKRTGPKVTVPGFGFVLLKLQS